MRIYQLSTPNLDAPELLVSSFYTKGADVRSAARNVEKDLRHDSAVRELELSTQKDELVAALNAIAAHPPNSDDPVAIGTVVREWRITARGGLELL